MSERQPIDTTHLPLYGYDQEGRPFNVGVKIDEKLGNEFDPLDFSTYPQTGIPSIGRSADEQLYRLTGGGVAQEDVGSVNTVVRRTEVTKQEVLARSEEIDAERAELQLKTGLRRKLANGALKRLDIEQAFLNKYDSKLPSSEMIADMGDFMRNKYGDVLRDEAIALAERDGVTIKQDSDKQS